MRYLAAKAKRDEAIKEKREREQGSLEEQESVTKKAKREEEAALAGQVRDLTGKALQLLVKDMQEGTAGLYRAMLGDKWEDGMEADLKRLQAVQAQERRRMREIEENKRKMTDRQIVSLKGGAGVYLDDVDARY